jgi:hypothetical protein
VTELLEYFDESELHLLSVESKSDIVVGNSIGETVDPDNVNDNENDIDNDNDNDNDENVVHNPALFIE